MFAATVRWSTSNTLVMSTWLGWVMVKPTVLQTTAGLCPLHVQLGPAHGSASFLLLCFAVCFLLAAASFSAPTRVRAVCALEEDDCSTLGADAACGADAAVWLDAAETAGEAAANATQAVTRSTHENMAAAVS